MPRADTTLEDYMDPMDRIDLAVESLRAIAAEEKQRSEQRAAPIKETAMTTKDVTFQSPVPPAMNRSAGVVSRSAAALMLGGLVSIFAAGMTEKGTSIMHDVACAAPLMDCQPR